MTVPDFVLLASAAVLLVVVVLAVWQVLRAQRAAAVRAAEAISEARAESAELRARIDALAARLVAAEQPPTETAAEWSITSIDEPAAPAGRIERIEGRLFADIVLRESVVKAAALGHGVRRAIAPETRNRVRFEMRREMKRLRKERKQTVRQLHREAAARQRARISAEEEQPMGRPSAGGAG